MALAVTRQISTCLSWLTPVLAAQRQIATCLSRFMSVVAATWQELSSQPVRRQELSSLPVRRREPEHSGDGPVEICR
ncbi:MAG: hypothetical protein DRQ55_19060 [Planctomycetota bacterium]|nr:MAG: hypothetical protein DRQ55_19060 [Planctomycetota bacterium]